MKNIFIIGADFEKEEEFLLKSTQNRKDANGHFVFLKDITIHLSEKATLKKDGKDFLEQVQKGDVFLIRRSRGDYHKLVAITEILEEKGIAITDSIKAVRTNLNKEIFLPTIESKIFPHPPNTFLASPDQSISKEDIHLPTITKPVLGRHGEGIEIHTSFETVQQAVNDAYETLIIQDCLDIEYEYRIFVLGDQYIGAVKKSPAPGEKVANYAAGATFERIEISDEEKNEAIRLCRHQGIDIAGVDIVRTADGKLYLLEINRCPEFKAFALATGIAISDKIIDFVISKK